MKIKCLKCQLICPVEGPGHGVGGGQCPQVSPDGRRVEPEEPGQEACRWPAYAAANASTAVGFRLYSVHGRLALQGVTAKMKIKTESQEK